MPRLRVIPIVSVIVAVLACAIFFGGTNKRVPEPFFQGHSASYWLRQVPGSQQNQAMEAFRQMGTNADPFLVAAIATGDDRYGEMFRRVYSRLPRLIRMRFIIPNDRVGMIAAAEQVLLKNSDSSEILYSRLRPMLQYPNVHVRIGALEWLGGFGRTASSLAPDISRLCSDKNLDVRIDAAEALWSITGQTNIAGPALEGVLREASDAHRRKLAGRYLITMGRRSDPFLITTLVEALASSQSEDRMDACESLEEIGPLAAAAIPALRKTFHDDPDGVVRLQARYALDRVDPSHHIPGLPSI